MRAARSHNRRAGHLHLGHETTDPTLIRAKRKRKKKEGEAEEGRRLTLVLHNRINGKSTFSNFKA